MLKKWSYQYLLRDKLSSARRFCRQFESLSIRADIENFQVDKFNDIWRIARTNIPFYINWQREYDLPDVISSLEELQKWPVLKKTDLREVSLFDRKDVQKPRGMLRTSGSTGEPLCLPVWGDPVDGLAQIVGRWAYGVGPGCRTFLLWGHRHLYGTGWRCKLNMLKRSIKDYVADWKRVSAYDLGADAMRRAYNVFCKFKPEFVIGFSAAIITFCRRNKQYAGVVRSVRTVLCTAGPLTYDEKTEIENFFGAKVCMEYGSVECSVMAYTRPEDDRYSVFWNTHLLQAQRQPDGELKNIVTRFAKSYIPLIRYDIGDCLDLGNASECDIVDAERSTLRFCSVKGRPNEMLQFASGVSFFGAIVGDCVKQVPGVIASQIAVNEEDDKLEVRIVADHLITEDEKRLIANRLDLTISHIDRLHLTVRQLESLPVTKGGKTLRVVRMC